MTKLQEIAFKELSSNLEDMMKLCCEMRYIHTNQVSKDKMYSEAHDNFVKVKYFLEAIKESL